MKSLFILAGFSFLALFAGMMNARKDGGEYWEGVKKDENGTSRNFEPRPNVSAYTDDTKDLEDISDFEPRPNVSAYTDADDTENESFVKFFEPRPNVSSYNDDHDDGKEMGMGMGVHKDFHQSQPTLSA